MNGTNNRNIFFLPVRCHLPGPEPQQGAVCTNMYTGSWMTSPLTGKGQTPSCRYAPDTHRKSDSWVWEPESNVASFIWFHSSFRLTCSLLQLSAAETMILSSLKRTSESLFRQMAEDVCTFVVSHNYKRKHQTGKREHNFHSISCTGSSVTNHLKVTINKLSMFIFGTSY